MTNWKTARAEEIAKKIREMDTWDFNLLEDLCYLAGMIDEWNEADSEMFESVAIKAAEKFNVELI